MSEGPDLAGQAYRRAFGGSGDEPSLWGAFQSARGKLIDPTLDPGEYGAWFGDLHPFEQQAARAAAANDIMSAVHAGRTDIFQSPLVQQRMQTAFGPGATADLLGKLGSENLAASLHLPGAQVVRGTPEPWDLTKFNAIPRYDPSANVAIPQGAPTTAVLPAPLAAWSAQQAQGQQ
ncbi:MAG TPA: hypothetical protein VGH03_03740 [Caulobacteraceae bacterium]